ncbi:endonuclease/exonuclease/phosphatase family protein [Nitratireductor sp. ZSWI3]|uniref:endonuclease/exonuclease/phosphatase family protein n=1 Tax=Nitratireductor sp. ZSWI3 TaxID=2966359 RepID=UPI00214F818C|nr:endonuclease/exonuclease/phosphatase family protein [Nitratireductor sp. ZSWI3]MCR4267454.1 endonuclease/exonuclease/phosphatase family protein [Nitratireductor sp. ZSWI3]
MKESTISTRLPALLAAVVTLMSLPLVAGYWGRLHPAFDAMAHFRLHLAFLLALLAVPLLLFHGWRRIGMAAVVLGIAALASTLAPGMKTAPASAADVPAARYRLLQMNLRYDNASPKKLFSLIGEVRPDVVTLNEVSRMWVEELKFLEATYPYRIICPPPARIGGVAILSRRPFLHPAAASCHDRGSMAVASVNFGGTFVDVAALHLGWPWPYEQKDQVQRVIPAVRQLGKTAILAGDLNAAPWSATARRLEAAGQMRIIAGIGATWFAPSFPTSIRRIAGLPIDNIFTKGGIVPISVRRMEDAGSDHLPVLFEFGLLPRQHDDEEEVMQVRL